MHKKRLYLHFLSETTDQKASYIRTFSIVLLQAASHIQLLHAVNLPIHHSSRLSRECATDDKDEDYLAEPGDNGTIF